MAYVEAFVVPVPKDKLQTYKEMSRLVEVIFRENGALDYVECVGDDVPYGTLTSFPRAVQAKEDEVVIFASKTMQFFAFRLGITAANSALPG